MMSNEYKINKWKEIKRRNNQKCDSTKQDTYRNKKKSISETRNLFQKEMVMKKKIQKHERKLFRTFTPKRNDYEKETEK